MAEWRPLADVALQPLPGRTFARSEGRVLDHATFHREFVRWHAAFGAAPGARFALHLEDATRFAAALFGAWHAGKTVVLPGDALSGTQARLQPHVDGFAGDWPGTVALSEGVATDGVFAPLDPEATRLVVFTSGSTGEPVAIEKRLRQLDAEVRALERALGEGLEDVAIHGTVSHQHIYGLLFRVLWPLAAGRAIVPRAFFPEDLLAAMEGHDAVLVASPAHLKRLPAQLDWSLLHGRLRAVFSSGGALPAEAAHDVARLLGVPPAEILGSSETGGIAWRRWDREQPAWQPLPGVDWKLTEGALEVRSPHLAEPAWWRTQDRAEADGVGGFRLLGRADRIVKVEERRVSLDALERQIQAHPAVREARVLLLGGSRSALAAVVVVEASVPLPEDAAGRRALANTLSRHLAGAQDAVTRPRRWRFVAAMPANAQGKVTEAALTALFRPERPEARWTLREPAHARVELPLDASLAVFEGHFTQAAILPGVAQLDWAVQLAREAFPLPPQFLRMEALKFQRVARPGDVIRLDLEWLAERSTLVFRYVSEHGPHASGRVVFADGE
ncbi:MULTISPECIES: AMP-binding protein [unclassified Pseudoxanthomonas]|uniref:AMP-binding protein n=1 Tax=unclassified Pseudoxanthomonas TaxID=2645906 RepID=UPI0008F0DDF0|nr:MULTISPECIES: AMP-binding protein [unclassified Pseudoxanthomonas]PPJ42749.1 AMP-binding protein [Pseudoxanthomonas sp. KAs_5_3]SFV26368.1 AMP-binding enzyme [Pseudoxanthomonas sp. YR558]